MPQTYSMELTIFFYCLFRFDGYWIVIISFAFVAIVSMTEWREYFNYIMLLSFGENWLGGARMTSMWCSKQHGPVAHNAHPNIVLRCMDRICIRTHITQFLASCSTPEQWALATFRVCSWSTLGVAVTRARSLTYTNIYAKQN